MIKPQSDTTLLRTHGTSTLLPPRTVALSLEGYTVTTPHVCLAERLSGYGTAGGTGRDDVKTGAPNAALDLEVYAIARYTCSGSRFGGSWPTRQRC